MSWQYTDATKRVVSRTLADGGQESCLVEAIAGWIAAGNIPDPAPAASPNPSVYAQIAALEDKQQRSVREFILGDTSAQARIKTIDDQIKALRSQLV